MDSNNEQSDDFGSFLESLNRAMKPSEVSNSSSMKIIHILAKLGEVEMAQLVAVVELPWSDFTSSIESLKAAGLVMMMESSQGGKVQLSSEGRRWAIALSSDPGDGMEGVE